MSLEYIKSWQEAELSPGIRAHCSRSLWSPHPALSRLDDGHIAQRWPINTS